VVLSKAAGRALGRANFHTPSPIQRASIPLQIKGENVILHAETGSGKTLAYLLPITEQLWREHDDETDGTLGFGIILTPTRELAAQVAGIATVLAPPGTVRMISHPTNLMSQGMALKERGEQEHGGRLEDDTAGRNSPRLFIGSAKALMTSLYGDENLPASPTTKPEAMFVIQNTRWLVLDEVDRLLTIKTSRGKASSRKVHEKPAAILTAAVARLTLGRAQVTAASATVGRPLKRELTRVLGLATQDCPQVVRGGTSDNNNNDREDNDEPPQQSEAAGVHVPRAVSIPNAVQNYVTPVDTSSAGQLLTSAFSVIKSLNQKPGRRILLVLTRGCGINTRNAIGALTHFGCKPEPTSLLDALAADGTDRMIQKHRQISGATGVGESSYFNNKEEQQAQQEQTGGGGGDGDDDGYLLVTEEATVRGIHLDGLDVVIVVGRPAGPDEYTHIAGRTGRAGRQGKVINVLSYEHTAAIKGWEKMLNVEFARLELEDVAKLD
jgi:hypothetical protein